ncbi:MAG TPA: SpoIIE family protein phosphatase [Candidatus Acidoferrum sp.]|jgi:sigma-B regulation protein RsbU (phosphoserine phosphatase)|nr:SpoIIE family protein phosphatase [Candidatus Acidoferrum sp.]
MVKSKNRSRSLAYATLVVLFVFSSIQWVRTCRDSIDYILHGEQIVRPPFGLNEITGEVNGRSPEAKAVGLENGDILLAVNGHPYEGLADYWGAFRSAKLGDSIRVRVRSTTPTGAVDKDLSIELPPFTYMGLTKAGSRAFLWIILPSILLPFFCLVLGFWVATVRIGDKSAWLLLFMLLGFAYIITESRTLYGNQDALQPFLTGFVWGFRTLMALALAFFGIAFPERLEFDRRYPWVKWAVFSPLVIEAVLAAAWSGLLLHHHAAARRLWPLIRPFNNVDDYLTPAACIFFCAVLIYRTATAKSRDARRRLVFLDVGAAVGILPYAALIVVSIVTHKNYPGWPTIVAISALLIFPLTMAYVIVVHRAMDVRLVIRQGLQYLLARNSIFALQIAIAVGISLLVATMSVGSSVAGRVLLFAIGLALIAGIRVFAQRLRSWIDRRFFREAYETDAILIDLAAKVRSIVETNSLLETVATRIASSLHVSRIAILLNQGGAFRPAYALGYGSQLDATIASESLTVKRLRKQAHALVNFEDADSWVRLADDNERASLEQMQAELLLPISLNEQVLGIMSLGTKQSEEAFSTTDIRLLDSVAAQTGLALENGRLTQAVATEVAEREKHKRELEIAREVQERLFPQEYPPVAGLDYAGACRPALGVGGDYYDFISLSKNELGIAIGDVSGKGIPAALLMATLRAFLRGQTVERKKDLTALMANLNRLVYESSESNRYATFFYAEFDSASRTMSYVNAGHNAPMVFQRRNGAPQIARLDTGGPVIGLMDGMEYSQGRVEFEPGDLFVAYTDGISEAMNAADEEWGEERLKSAVLTNQGVPAKVYMERLMASADAFVAGARQHDDMTLIVLRVF